MSKTAGWYIMLAYAAAMAWVESAVVFYLRTMVDRIDPYQANPLPLVGGVGAAELVREAATLIMLLTVGMLAGKTWSSRLGFSAIIFGVWDILYYVFLKVMTGWPKGLLDWDILFLLPLPWWGPVLAPMLIAALMITWGTMAVWFEDKPRPSEAGVVCWLLNGPGIVVALYVFMTDALRVADQGTDALRQVLPATFNWPLFIAALIFMSVPILRVGWRGRTSRVADWM